MGKKWKIENHGNGFVCIRKNNKNEMDSLKMDIVKGKSGSRQVKKEKCINKLSM